MSDEMQEGERRLIWPEWVLIGLIASIVIVDSTLLFAPLSTGLEHFVRLGLTSLSFLAILVSLGLGIVRTPIYAVGALLVLPFVLVYSYTGLLLPWTQLSLTLGQALTEVLPSVPFVGETLAYHLLGGVSLSQQTLQIAFRHHYLIVGIALFGLVYALVRTASRSSLQPRV